MRSFVSQVGKWRFHSCVYALAPRDYNPASKEDRSVRPKKTDAAAQTLRTLRDRFELASAKHRLLSIVISAPDDEKGREQIKGPDPEDGLREVSEIDKAAASYLLQMPNTKELRGIYLIGSAEAVRFFEKLTWGVGSLLGDLPRSRDLPPECVEQWRAISMPQQPPLRRISEDAVAWLLLVHALSLRDYPGTILARRIEHQLRIGGVHITHDAALGEEPLTHLFSYSADILGDSVFAIDLLLSPPRIRAKSKLTITEKMWAVLSLWRDGMKLHEIRMKIKDDEGVERATASKRVKDAMERLKAGAPDTYTEWLKDHERKAARRLAPKRPSITQLPDDDEVAAPAEDDDPEQDHNHRELDPRNRTDRRF